MGGIVAEEADADVGHGADLSRADQLAGERHGRCVAVVEAHRPLHPGLARRLGHGPRVGGGEADGLLDPDVLARLRHGGADLAVAKPYRAAASSARPGTSSATATSSGRTSSCGKWWGTRRYAWVCTLPIQPNPTTATPSACVMTASLDQPTTSGTHDLSPGGPPRSPPPGRWAPPRRRPPQRSAGGAGHRPVRIGGGRGPAVRRGRGEAVAHAGPG